MSKQLLKPSLAQARKMELMPLILMKQTKDANQAVKFMLMHSGSTQEAVGDEVGKPRETITRFANGNGGLSANEITKLMLASGNLFLLQYWADFFGCELVRKDIKAHRREELMAELEALENAA
jgi:hypothetical protein